MPTPPGGRVKVLYLLSAGRSGSTLLERVIGQFPTVESIGELYAVWEVGVREDVRCGCGERFSSCPLWISVFKRAFGGIDQVDGAAMEEFWRRNDQMAGEHLRRLLTAKGRTSLRAATDAASVLDALYAGIAAETGAELIVDTSKSAFHPYFMLGSPVVDPYILHLVRDPRGVAYSWASPKQELGYDDGRLMPAKSAAFSAAWWVLQNFVDSRLGIDAPGRYMRLRYEDFVAEPEREVRRVGALCGLDLDPAVVFGGVEADARPTHSVWGNPMRFEQNVEIRADERWRREMSSRDQRLVSLATLPWRRGYGYVGD